jgi:hypothetical protein
MMAFHRCPLLSICIPSSVEFIDTLSFSAGDVLQSMTFDPPSRIRFLLSFPVVFCSSVDIPDSVEVLRSMIRVEPGRHVVFSFGPNSHLRCIDVHAYVPHKTMVPARDRRAFLRLPEASLSSFRSDIVDDGPSAGIDHQFPFCDYW